MGQLPRLEVGGEAPFVWGTNPRWHDSCFLGVGLNHSESSSGSRIWVDEFPLWGPC